MIRFLALALLLATPAAAAPLMLAAPPVTIRNDAALAPAVAWQDTLARETDTARIVGQLLLYAAADAAADVRIDDSRVLLPRRIGGAMMVWRRIRPQVEAGKHRDVIDAWMARRAGDMVATFDRLRWGNNLDAAGAMAVYATGDALGDDTLRQAGLRIARRVLDQIDAEGFTKEILRADKLAKNKDAAEYYSHETMIYLVAVAQMSGSLWDEPGRAGGDPAMLRAGRLLDADLGTGARYAARTGKKQIAYPSAIKIATLPSKVETPPSKVSPLPSMLIPSGFLGCWMAPFVAHYGPGFPRLQAAAGFYAASPARSFNATVGGVFP